MATTRPSTALRPCILWSVPAITLAAENGAACAIAYTPVGGACVLLKTPGDSKLRTSRASEKAEALIKGLHAELSKATPDLGMLLIRHSGVSHRAAQDAAELYFEKEAFDRSSEHARRQNPGPAPSPALRRRGR